jgi:hypothetical protein
LVLLHATAACSTQQRLGGGSNGVPRDGVVAGSASPSTPPSSTSPRWTSSMRLGAPTLSPTLPRHTVPRSPGRPGSGVVGVRLKPNSPNTLRSALLVSRILLGFCILAGPLLPWEAPNRRGYVPLAMPAQHLAGVVAPWSWRSSPCLSTAPAPGASAGGVHTMGGVDAVSTPSALMMRTCNELGTVALPPSATPGSAPRVTWALLARA